MSKIPNKCDFRLQRNKASFFIYKPFVDFLNLKVGSGLQFYRDEQENKIYIDLSDDRDAFRCRLRDNDTTLRFRSIDLFEHFADVFKIKDEDVSVTFKINRIKSNNGFEIERI